MTLPIGPHSVESLREKIEELEFEIQELRNVLGANDDIDPLRMLGLSPLEARLVNALLKRPIVTKPQAMYAMYVDDPDKRLDVQDKMVDVMICKARKVLKRVGVNIETIGHSLGWRMLGPDKSRLQSLIRCRAAVLNGKPSDGRLRANRREFRAAAE